MTFLYTLKLLVLALYHAVGYLFASIGKTGVERQRVQMDWVYQLLVRLGPVYIKIGQIAATRSDLIPGPWIERLKTLQDDVPHMNEAATRQILTRELGRPVEEAFATFSFTPIASASIAQVHAAALRDGRKVAVKIVKKNVREQLGQSMAVIRALVAAVHRLSATARQLELPSRVAELSTLLLAQTDLDQEAERQEMIRANYKDHPYVLVPAVIGEHSTRCVLVMEFVEGIAGKNVRQVKLAAPRLAQRFQDSIYTMLYMHGLCHGDPHPGNIFFTEDGRIILLDFGITVQLGEDEKWGLSSFYYACTRKEWEIAVARFTEHFVTDKERIQKSWETYVGEISKVLRHHFDVSSSQWSMVSYFRDVNGVLRRYGAKYSSNFTKVELVFLSCEGFATQIDPNIDIWANARRFTDRYSPYMSAEIRRAFDQFFGEKIPSSMELKRKADHYMVAPTHMHRYFFPSTYPLFIKKASGGNFEDVDGNRYIDLSGGYGPHILGYAHPAVATALVDGIQAGFVNAIGNEPELELSQLIVEALPGIEKAILCNSGTEAALMAVRLCRAYRRRSQVAKFEGHYHGWSDQGMVSSWFRFTGPTLSPMPISGTRGCDENTVRSTLILQYGHVEGLRRLREAASELACVIVEPMPSSIVNYDKEFLLALRALCTELDLPLVFDEVVTGFRVAYGGAQSLAGVTPDLTCLGKIIGGGLPCGAVAGRRALLDIAKSSEDPFYDYEHKAFLGGTTSGNSLTCIAGTAALRHLKANPQIYSDLERRTRVLAEKLLDAARSVGVQFRVEGRHSIFSMSFSHKGSKFYREKQAGSNFKATIALAYYMRKHGVYIPELHAFLLSAAHSDEDLEAVVGAFELSLREMTTDGFFVS